VAVLPVLDRKMPPEGLAGQRIATLFGKVTDSPVSVPCLQSHRDGRKLAIAMPIANSTLIRSGRLPLAHQPARSDLTASVVRVVPCGSICGERLWPSRRGRSQAPLSAQLSVGRVH
jgi:hypothetical protein